jgi:hypothetical protein
MADTVELVIRVLRDPDASDDAKELAIAVIRMMKLPLGAEFVAKQIRYPNNVCEMH